MLSAASERLAACLLPLRHQHAAGQDQPTELPGVLHHLHFATNRLDIESDAYLICSSHSGLALPSSSPSSPLTHKSRFQAPLWEGSDFGKEITSAWMPLARPVAPGLLKACFAGEGRTHLRFDFKKAESVCMAVVIEMA